jgi:hypothetical protein
MLRQLREQSRTPRTNPSEPEAKSLSSQPPPKILESPQATTTATNYTISDDRSNSSRHAHNLLLALQHESRGTLFASFEPQTVTSAGLSSEKYPPDQGPPPVRQHREERTASYPPDPDSPKAYNLDPWDVFYDPTGNTNDTSRQIPEFAVSIPRVRSVCDVTSANLANHVGRCLPR